MIFGSFSEGNFVMLIAGLFSVPLGFVALSSREEFKRAAEQIQRSMGKLGQKIADKNQRWPYTMFGVCSIVFGFLMIVVGLLYAFPPVSR